MLNLPILSLNYCLGIRSRNRHGSGCCLDLENPILDTGIGRTRAIPNQARIGWPMVDVRPGPWSVDPTGMLFWARSGFLCSRGLNQFSRWSRRCLVEPGPCLTIFIRPHKVIYSGMPLKLYTNWLPMKIYVCFYAPELFRFNFSPCGKHLESCCVCRFSPSRRRNAAPILRFSARWPKLFSFTKTALYIFVICLSAHQSNHGFADLSACQ